ncbi:hypothetical protein [uncultured Phenylobacterium sp.]|uniref:hypothetical protein n=1 Tax=uncultured Phenylobacterium sp. TaxID=349273 RepID=UPI0025D45AC4|nr:hypothetical protein [uncultured Phenylobacterium sp.]
MQPDFILRKNIERFRHLLAAGNLSALQAKVVANLLELEVEALATWQNAEDAPKPPSAQ